MGYFISGKKRKDGTQAWGLVFRSDADGKRVSKRIRQTDLRQYGLLPSMPIEEARSRCKQLNLETAHLAREESRKLRTLEQAQLTRQMGKRLFPEQLVDEFISERLKPKFFFGGANPQAKYDKALSRWRFCLKMVEAVDKLPKDWAREPREFYKYFTDQQVTAGYAVKCLVILNMWGFFVSEKQGTPFLPVPAPRGYDRQVIEDEADNKEGAAKESLPLTPELLESAKESLKPSFYRWVFVTLWFGLRPQETENEYKVVTQPVKGKKVKILEVYQSKLVGAAVAKAKRWKRIPVLYPEQEQALVYLQEGRIEKPYLKALKKALGQGYLLYAGRKGFTDLMLDRGQQLVNVSRWLGHSSIDQTLKAYKDKERVEFD